MTPEQHEALTHIDADRKRWMACELQVDCQISSAEAAELVEEFFRDAQLPSEPVGWWYQDSTGCIHMSLDMDLGRRHEQETGHPLNMMYGKPLPSGPRGADPPPQTHAVGNVITLREAAQALLDVQKAGQQHFGYRIDLWNALEATLAQEPAQ